MPGISLGIPILLVVAVLIFLGLAHRVLDRLYLTDKTALLIIAAMVVGSFIDLPLGNRLSLNVGGGLIPIALAGYVLSRAGTSREWGRALLAIVVTTASLFAANRLIGAEPETMVMDPLIVYPVLAGLVAYLMGRSRRTAFIAATLSILFLDIGTLIWMTTRAIPGTMALGGAGVFDSMVIAGVIAVLLAEVMGESRERLQGGPAQKGRPPALLENLRGFSLRERLYPVERKPGLRSDQEYTPFEDETMINREISQDYPGEEDELHAESMNRGE